MIPHRFIFDPLENKDTDINAFGINNMRQLLNTNVPNIQSWESPTEIYPNRLLLKNNILMLV